MNQQTNKATIEQAILNEAREIRALLDNSTNSETQGLEMMIQMQGKILECLEQLLSRLECLSQPQAVRSLPT